MSVRDGPFPFPCRRLTLNFARRMLEQREEHLTKSLQSLPEEGEEGEEEEEDGSEPNTPAKRSQTILQRETSINAIVAQQGGGNIKETSSSGDDGENRRGSSGGGAHLNREMSVTSGFGKRGSGGGGVINGTFLDDKKTPASDTLVLSGDVEKELDEAVDFMTKRMQAVADDFLAGQ